MQIARNLKLVLPIRNGDELIMQVYAEPISRVAFEASHKMMGRAWSDLNAAGIGSVGLMTTASFALKDSAVALYGEEEGSKRYSIFMTEVLNGASVILPNHSLGQVPYINAVGSKLISEDDNATVESLLAFFTLASRMVDPQWGHILRTGLALNFGAQYTSLSFTEYRSSLQTSKTEESSTSPGAS